MTNDEMLAGVRRRLERYEFTMAVNSRAPIQSVFLCCCLGPLPDCPCAVERKAVAQFLGPEYLELLAEAKAEAPAPVA